MQNQEKIVAYVLLKIGIPAHFRGFAYLKRAVLHVLENSDFLSMGELYDAIANFDRKSWGKVERGMRYAIETAFNKSNGDLQNSLFNNAERFPSNSHFIYTIAEYIRLLTNENHQFIDELTPLLSDDSDIAKPLENQGITLRLLPKSVTVSEKSVSIEKNLRKIVCGYMYMTLEDLKYSPEDMLRVVQILEINVSHNHYEYAIAEYERAEAEYAPVIIDGIVVPSEYNDMKIAELPFSTVPMGARITKALSRSGIEYIKDFRNKVVDFRKLRNFGSGSLDELKTAIRQEMSGV